MGLIAIVILAAIVIGAGILSWLADHDPFWEWLKRLEGKWEL